MQTRLSRTYYATPGYARLLLKGQLFRALSGRRHYFRQQRQLMTDLSRRCPEFTVIEEIVDRRSPEPRPISGEIAQFWYASTEIERLKPREIHDVGSHRSWLMGVAARIPVHSLDVVRPPLCAANEVFHQGRAEDLPFGSESVECLTSLCSLEHFGLGSYGDPYDPEGDRRAIREMVRVLQPAGHLVLTTLCTGLPRPFIVFNTRRVYTVGLLRQMLEEMELAKEGFFSMRFRRFVGENELHAEVAPYAWDVYMSTWRKPLRTS